MRASLLAGPDCVEQLKNEWQDLVRESYTATPFQTWEWQSTWLRHFRKLKQPLVLTVRDGSDLVGLLPLTRSAGTWTTMRTMGTGASDYLHPLIRSGREEDVSALMAESLRKFPRVDLLDLHQVRVGTPIAVAINPERTIEQATCLVLDLPADYETYLGTLSKSLRYDVRKLDKALFSSGRATVEQVGEDEIDKGLDILFEQHKLRWRKRGLPGAFIGRAQAFHQDWGRQAIANGWLWLSILKLDNNPIGAIYAMRLGDTCYYYQAGFDPQFGSVSPGTLLVAATIRRAIAEGLAHFDFLRGDEPYKRRWKPQHEHKNLRLLASSGSGRGKFGLSWNEAGSTVEAKVRARLEGKGLFS